MRGTCWRGLRRWTQRSGVLRGLSPKDLSLPPGGGRPTWPELGKVTVVGVSENTIARVPKEWPEASPWCSQSLSFHICKWGCFVTCRAAIRLQDNTASGHSGAFSGGTDPVGSYGPF